MVKKFSVLLILVAMMVAVVAVAQDSGMVGVDAQAAVQSASQSLSASFWGGVDHIANVLVDFLGRIFMKIADAVLAVLHGVGIGTGR